MVTYKAGKQIKRYEKITQSARNEPLDCRVYNIAALYLLNPKYEVLQQRMRLLQQDRKPITVTKKKPQPQIQKPSNDPNIIQFQGDNEEQKIDKMPKLPQRSRNRSGFEVVW